MVRLLPWEISHMAGDLQIDSSNLAAKAETVRAEGQTSVCRDRG